MPAIERGPTRVVLLNAPEDAAYCAGIERHLLASLKSGSVEIWHRGHVQAGAPQVETISQHIHEADIILVLLSAEFLTEPLLQPLLPQVLARQQTGAWVIPVLSRPVNSDASPFSGLRPLPSNGRPLSSRRDQDAAFAELAKEVAAVISTDVHRLGDADVATAPTLNDALIQYRQYRESVYGGMALDEIFRSIPAASRIRGLDRRALFIPPEVRFSDNSLNVPRLPGRLEGRMSVLQAMKTSRWLLLLGAPGAGKTEVIRWVMASLGVQRDALPGLPDDLVPVHIDLPDFDEIFQKSGGQVDNFLAYMDRRYQRLSQGLHGEFLHNLAEQGRLFWLFDGMDELPVARRRFYLEMLVGLVHQRTARPARGIITGRVEEARSARDLLGSAGVDCCTLEKFDDDKVKLFIERFYQPGEQSAKAALLRHQLLQSLMDSPSLHELCRNPLHLTLLALLNYEGDLPRRRYRIYQKFTDRMLDGWDANQGHPSPHFEWEDKVSFLRDLGWWMQKEHPEGIVAPDELISFAAAYCQERFGVDWAAARRKAESLTIASARCALLTPTEDGNFGFVHKSFLEYFAAEAAISKQSGESLHLLFQERWTAGQGWGEVLTLLCGLLDERGQPWTIIRALQAVLGTGSASNPLFHLLFSGFAIRCLAEVGSVRQEPMRSFVDLIGDLAQHTAMTLPPASSEDPTADPMRSVGEALARSLANEIRFFGPRWPFPERWLSWAMDQRWSDADGGLRSMAVRCALAASDPTRRVEWLTTLVRRWPEWRIAYNGFGEASQKGPWTSEEIRSLEQHALAALPGPPWAYLWGITAMAFFNSGDQGQLKELLADFLEHLGVPPQLPGTRSERAEWLKTFTSSLVAHVAPTRGNEIIRWLAQSISLLERAEDGDMPAREEVANVLGNLVSAVVASWKPEAAKEAKDLVIQNWTDFENFVRRFADTHVTNRRALIAQFSSLVALRGVVLLDADLRQFAWRVIEFQAEGDQTILQAIERYLMPEFDEPTRIAAAQILAHRGVPQGRQALLALARTAGDAQIVLDAFKNIAMLGILDDGVDLPARLHQLAEEATQPQVRIDAVLKLMDLTDSGDAESALVRLAQGDINEVVRASAALALSRRRTKNSDLGAKILQELVHSAQSETARYLAAVATADYPVLGGLARSAIDETVRCHAGDIIALLRLRTAILRLGLSTRRRGMVLLRDERVGLIEETEGGSRFTYDVDWLIRPDALPVSQTLPLSEVPYESRGVHPFFENLLPEGYLLEQASRKLKIDKTDSFGLLLMTCRHCTGAVDVHPLPDGAS